jgi:hypothetical protein
MLFLVLILFVPHDRGFDFYKERIAKHESDGGRLKINFNSNRTADVGRFQINTAHFTGQGSVGREFDKIFKRHGIGEAMHERVVAAIVDDKLNEELARKLYQMRGLKSWTSSRKFIK